MKNFFAIIILFLLALPVLAEEEIVFLTNQNEDETTQFEISDEIYIKGICLPAASEAIKVYITYDKTWKAGDTFSDISGGIETFEVPYSAIIPRTKIWGNLIQGAYDVVIDTNNDFKLQPYEEQCVIGLTEAGFRVGSPPPPPPPAPYCGDGSCNSSETCLSCAADCGICSPPSSNPASPPPPLEPTALFSLDQYVEVRDLANVRKSAGGTLLGTQTQGVLGIVAGGPVQASLGGKNFWFWNINFEDDLDGWVAESTIKSAPTPAPTETEEPVTEEGVVDSTLTEGETEVPTSPEPDINKEALAQVSSADNGSGLNSFWGFVIIGVALFCGLIFGSTIIARALRKN